MTCYYCDIQLVEVEPDCTSFRRMLYECPSCSAAYIVIPAMDGASADSLVELSWRRTGETTA